MRFSANKAFVGCMGITAEFGITTAVLAEVAINELMFQQCTGLRFVLAESTKIGHNHSFVSSAISQVDFLITDNGANPEATQKLRDKGVKIVHVVPET